MWHELVNLNLSSRTWLCKLHCSPISFAIRSHKVICGVVVHKTTQPLGVSFVRNSWSVQNIQILPSHSAAVFNIDGNRDT